MKLLGTAVAIILALPYSALAQDLLSLGEVPCAIDNSRIVRGVVTDARQVPAYPGWVVFPDHRCGTPVDSAGRYVIREAPKASAILVFVTFGRGAVAQRIEGGLRDTVVDIEVPVIQKRVRAWSSYPSRPPTPVDASGIPGCYWMGYALFGPDQARGFQLHPDGRVFVDAEVELPDPKWSASEDGDQVFIRFYTGLSNLTAAVDFAEAPVDMSSLPTLFRSVQDHRLFDYPTEWDSFITRVECAGGDSS